MLEVNKIRKCLSKILGFHPKKWGAKNCLFCDSYFGGKMGQQFLPTFHKRWP